MTAQSGQVAYSPTRDVRCPNCTVRFSDPECDGFEVVVPYKAASCNALAGFDAEGRMVLGAGDAGDPSWFGEPQLVCNGCGHQWTTTRKWGGINAE